MRRFTPLFVLCALLAVEVRAAHAQTGQVGQTSRPGRPYRGLFGGDGSSEDPGQALSATVSFGGGYDDNLRAEASGGRGIGRDGTIQGGSLGTVGGTLNYVSTGDRSSWNATVGASTRYYPSLNPHTVSSRNASIDTSRQLTSRTSLNLSASASYRPFWLGGPTSPGRFRSTGSVTSCAQG